jgi:hypothetical protein
MQNMLHWFRSSHLNGFYGQFPFSNFNGFYISYVYVSQTRYFDLHLKLLFSTSYICSSLYWIKAQIKSMDHFLDYRSIMFESFCDDFYNKLCGQVSLYPHCRIVRVSVSLVAMWAVWVILFRWAQTQDEQSCNVWSNVSSWDHESSSCIQTQEVLFQSMILIYLQLTCSI